MSERIVATYRIETGQDLERAAAAMAGEQSTGTFVKVPGETATLRARHGARVERLSDLGPVDLPTLPGAKLPAEGHGFRRAEVVLSFPLENMGPSLPNLVATVMGNLYEQREFSGLRLLDLELPAAFATAYPGPQFGVEGTRRLSGVFDRPILGTIVKPAVGLSPAETAALVEVLVEAGLDFVKDDELQADGPHCPFEARVEAVMRVLHAHADRTGRKVMFAFNLTGEIDEMKRRHDVVVAKGGTCVMASLHSVGFVGLAALRRHAQVPIHGHRNGWGLYTRCPELGVEYVAWQKLWRVAGADHLHVNGLRNKYWEPDDSVVVSARAVRAPLFGGYQAMPVFSSAQWAGQAVDTYRALGHVDLMYLCGGGIMAHPGGVAAGVRSVRQAWEAALAGRELKDAAHEHEELRAALERYGRALV